MAGGTSNGDQWTASSSIEEDTEPYEDEQAREKGERRHARLMVAKELDEALKSRNLAAARAALAELGDTSSGDEDRQDRHTVDVEQLADLDSQALAAAHAALAALEAAQPLAAMAIPTEPDLPAWLLPNWMPAGRISFLSGRGGAGKSRLALQLGAAVAVQPDGPGPGVAFLDPDGHGSGNRLLTAQGGPVVISTWEDDAQTFGWRLNHLLEGCTWPDRSNIRERLHVVDLAAHGPVWGPRGFGHTSSLGALTPTGAKLRDYAEELGARLLVLDPLAAASAVNENDRGLVRQFMSNWDAWARASECAVLLISHPAKASAGEAADYSGSTDWRNAARAALLLDRRPAPGDDSKPATRHPCLVLDKSSYGPPQPPRWLTQEGTVWRQVEQPRPPRSTSRVAREVAP